MSRDEDQGPDVEILEIVGLDEDLNEIHDELLTPLVQQPVLPPLPAIPPAILREEGRRMGWRQALIAMLPALDALEDCIRQRPDPEQLQGGVRLALRGLWDVYRQNGLERIEESGGVFDPSVQEAALVTPTDRVPEGTVLETLRVGYVLGGEMVRPALVRVAIPMDVVPVGNQIDSEED
jgi:hypothetical protein